MFPNVPRENTDLRPIKRRRTNAPLTLQTLPLEALKLIMHYLHPPSRASRSQTLLNPSNLLALAPLRALSSQFRDAFDLHVTGLELSGLSPASLGTLIISALPRFPNLTKLALSEDAVDVALLTHWTYYFCNCRAHLQTLTYVSDSPDESVPSLFAASCSASLESISTTSMPLLKALSRHLLNIRSLELLMDDIDVRVLQYFPARSLHLLYRKHISVIQSQNLVITLNKMATLQAVELRLNHIASTDFSLFPNIPRLHKLSLFDGEIVDTDRGMRMITACGFLEEVQMEWMSGLTGNDIAFLARGMAARLKRLRIWNCAGVTDEGLMYVATFCPNVEVELRFVREQFRSTTLAMFGDRISWASSI